MDRQEFSARRRGVFGIGIGVVASMLSGALLFISDQWVCATALQLVAFVPFLVAARKRDRWIHGAILGSLLGVTRYVLLGARLNGLHPAAWVGVPVYLIGIHALFGVATLAAHRHVPAVLVPLATAVAFGAMEFADAHLPMWGSALSLACAWSSHPKLIGLILPFVGTFGIAFIVVAIQAFAVSWFFEREPLLIGMFGVVLCLPLGFAWRRSHLAPPHPQSTSPVYVEGCGNRVG